MANQNTSNTLAATSIVTPEKLKEVESLLSQLKEDAQKAHDANDIFMLSVYNELLQVCSSVVVKAYARLEREQRAAFNKAHKALRIAEREAKAAQNGSPAA